MRRNARTRFPGLALGAMLVTLVLIAAACGSSSSVGSNAGKGKKIVVGEKNFAGAQLLSQLYGQALAAKGFSVSYKQLGTTEVTYAALKSGSIDLYGEYQGTLLDFLKGTPSGDSGKTNSALQDKVKADNVKASNPPSTAIDVNGFYVTKSTASKYHLKKVSDLKSVASKLTFGGPPECDQRPLCLGSGAGSEQQLYGLHFKAEKKLDTGGPITDKALSDGTIDVGLLFTGSSVIDKDFVLLTDDKGLQPADAAIAVWRDSVDSSALDSVVKSVDKKLDTAAYNEMALKIFNDKQDPSAVAKDWLSKNGLT